LVVSVLAKDAVVGVLDKCQYFGLEVFLELRGQLMLLVHSLRNPLDTPERVLKRILVLIRACRSLREPLPRPVHLQQPRERVLHEEDGLVLHHLIIIAALTSLTAVAVDYVEQHLLVLGHRLALLG
jgi:hypothetical protein